jgi:RecJ-like exonuclease
MNKKMETCANCEGAGKHSKAIGIITSEDREEWSDEEFDAYMGGAYDRRCEVCHGTGKVLADDNRCEKYYATDEEYYWKREGGY